MGREFHDPYQVKSGDTLSRIGLDRGFSNPGPIFAYPPNKGAFPPNFTPEQLQVGTTLYIPWRPDLLRKIIATSEYLGAQVAKSATEFIRSSEADRKDIDDFLFKIDAVNFLANIGFGIGSLAAKGMKQAEMTSEQAMEWLVDSRASVGGGIATMAIPSPEAPKRDFKFFIRHTLGPWNPSFWATVALAVTQKDLQLYLYGPDAIRYRTCEMIKQSAERDIVKLRQTINAARNQLAAPFYNYRM